MAPTIIPPIPKAPELPPLPPLPAMPSLPPIPPIPEANRTFRAYWSDWSNRVAAATLVLVGAYTGLQLIQNWLTWSNNVISERAFVLPTPDKFTFNGPGDQEIATVNLVNSGNTPTEDLHFFIRCAISQTAVPDAWSLLDESPVSVAQIIGPHASSRRSAPSAPVTSRRGPRAGGTITS